MATKRKASSAAEGAESTLKARRGNLAESAWHAAVVADIDSGDKAAVQATIARLKALQKRGQARLLQLETGGGGCGVRLVRSMETEDADHGCNMASRSVEASFTAGPKKAPFSISFNNEDVEGEETIRVESELFSIEDGDWQPVTYAEIQEFLTKAGLGASTTMNSSERPRRVYADIIRDAVKLVLKKHGQTSGLGVDLGMQPEDIYDGLGLRS